MPSRTEAFAPAKINLLLHVGDKRADGYHALESLVVFVDIGDTLVFEAADGLSLSIGGPFGEGLAGEADNLVLRAARALAEHAGVEPSAKITLTKNLPVASGIGGGSADAAATLRGLVRLWALTEYGPWRTAPIAEALGSDVPVCLESFPAWMEGRGEFITRVKGITPTAMVLVNPGVAVPTGKVFGALKTRSGLGKMDRSPLYPDPWALADYLKSNANDLEAPALEIAPVIGDVLEILRAQPDVYIARMSGSGATCFALFKDRQSAEAAEQAIANAHPQWWVKATQVLC